MYRAELTYYEDPNLNKTIFGSDPDDLIVEGYYNNPFIRPNFIDIYKGVEAVKTWKRDRFLTAIPKK